MEFCVDAMLCSNMGKENSNDGHIKCSRGPHLARGPCSIFKESLETLYFEI